MPGKTPRDRLEESRERLGRWQEKATESSERSQVKASERQGRGQGKGQGKARER